VVADLSTWETTRSTAAEQLEKLSDRQGEHAASDVRDGLFLQEMSRLRAYLRELDLQESDVRRKAKIQESRPRGCSCLGTGGIGMLTAVMSDGLTVFEDYCVACPEGNELRELATWANAGIEEDDRIEQERVKQEQREAREREILARSGIDQRYARCTFQTFRDILTERRALRKDLDRALAAMEQAYTEGTPLRGDYIYGEPGHGKTSLQVAMARALIARGRTCIFIHYGDLLERMRAAYGRKDGSSDDLLERMRNAPVLFMDDFMMVQASRYELGRITTLLVARHAAGRRLLTGFNSNYDIKEAALRLSEGVEDGRHEAKRIEGRLREMCDEIHLRTIDLRTGLREHVVS